MPAGGAQTTLAPCIYCDEHHVISICRDVVLSYSIQQPNPHYLQAWRLAMDELVDELRTPISVVIIIDSKARAPDDASRNLIRATVTSHSAQIDALVYVIEGTGFGAAAMRSAISLIALAARYPFSQKTFSTIDEAAPWLVRRDSKRTRQQRVAAEAELISVGHGMRGHLL